VDVHVQQVSTPADHGRHRRALAQQVGLTQRTSPTLLISLTGSGATTTNFWINYKNGVSYQVVVQTPARVASLDELHRSRWRFAGQASPSCCATGGLPSDGPLRFSLNTTCSRFDVYATSRHRPRLRLDRGQSDHREVRGTDRQGQLDRRRGQVQSMNSRSSSSPSARLRRPVRLFLMVVNPVLAGSLIILMASPARWRASVALFVTGTTITCRR